LSFTSVRRCVVELFHGKFMNFCDNERMRPVVMCCLLFFATAFAADRDLTGRFAGEWKSAASGNGGEIRFSLEAATGGGWKSDLTFALGGAEVKTTMREVKLQDGKIELVYDFDVQGANLRSRVKGEWNGTAFRGQYETTLTHGSEGVDNGTWNAARGK
jgi:hypothetical protein